MARKRLTKAQKARNKAKYNEVKKIYNSQLKGKTDMTYQQFRNNVKSLLNIKKKRTEKEKAITKFSKDEIKAAAKKEAHTEQFVTPAQRAKENLLAGMKEKHNDVYKEVQNKFKGRGKKGNMEERIMNSLKWKKGENGEKSGYELVVDGKKYFIDVSNSPEEYTLVEVE